MTTPLQFGIQGQNQFAPAFQELERRISSVQGKNESWIKSLSHLTQSARNVFAGFKTMVSGIEALLAPSQKLVNLEVQLAASMARTGQLTEESHKKLVAFAASRQDVTLFAREVTLRMANIGAEFGLTTDEITRSITAVQDRAVALGRDPVDLYRGLAKALVGIGNEWTELGLKVDTTASRHEKLNQVLKQITPGMAEVIASLPTNAFARLGLKLVDIADGIGRVIASTRVFQSVMGWLDGFAKSLRNALGDPGKLAAIAAVIDNIVQRVVQAFAYGASIIVRVAGTVVQALEDIRETIMLTVNGGAIKELSEQYQQLWIATDTGAERSASVRDALSGMMAKMAQLSGGASRLGPELLEMANGMERFARQSTIFAGVAPTVVAAVRGIVGALSKKQDAPGVSDGQQSALELFQRDLEERHQLEAEMMQRALEENERWGQDMADTFSRGFQRAFDRDVGIQQSFRMLGNDIMQTFIGQFGAAAFDPVKAAFGELAKALAEPFKLVGRLISAVLSPITNLISTAINYLIEQFLTMIGVQVAGAATSAGIMKALGAEIAGTAAGWGAAAVAASIATLGGALSSVPAAMGAIGAGAGLTASLVTPAAAAGAFVEPRPGGTLVRVAEAGQAEVIAPMPKLEAAVGRAMRLYGGGGGLSVHFNAPIGLGESKIARRVADELFGELALGRTRDRSFRGGMF